MKCGAEIKEDLNFCTNCGKKIRSGSTEEGIRDSMSDRESHEHTPVKKEISWKPVISAIIRSAVIIALYFLIEAWFLAPEIRETVTADLQDNQMLYSLTDVEQLVGTILSPIRISLISIEIISLILNLLVKARHILYVTNW